jgi:electron transfer flavoprotein alpha subunit
VTLALCGLARSLALPTSAAVTVALLGHDVDRMTRALVAAADRVLCLRDAELANYQVDAYLAVLEQLIRARRPVLTLMAHSTTGMDLAPALAVRLGLPLCTDCLRLTLSDGRLEVHRQAYGGKIAERLALRPAAGYLVTVRPGSDTPAAGGAGALEPLPAVDLKGRLRRRFLEYLAAEAEDVDIAAADILVSVGRGVGEQANMAPIEALARALGATLSCSRPVADKGWLPKSRQVGTSGKMVRPKVYLALGISGAYQHVAGMHQAGLIIAVNKDPAAPIFEVAHYGIVADMFALLPRLLERLTR